MKVTEKRGDAVNLSVVCVGDRGQPVTFDQLQSINQSINQRTFVTRHKSRVNRRCVKKKARPSGYRKLWQQVPSLKNV